MEKKNTYTELMKSCAMTRKKANERSVLDIYIEMVICESLWMNQKEKLIEEINQSLDERNQTKFIKLSNKLKQLNLQYGT